jgi:hypothetical protein
MPKNRVGMAPINVKYALVKKSVITIKKFFNTIQLASLKKILMFNATV